jgi:hypothetical protein
MSQANYASKGRRSKKALSVLGLAGIYLAVPAATTNESMAAMPSPATAPVRAFALGEEEISDVTLATFHLFDKETIDQSRSLLHLTRCGCGCGGGGCRCGGGGGCGGGGCRCGFGGGCRCGFGGGCRCGFGGCRCGFGGCGCGGCGGCGGGGCCITWGGCIPWC